MNSRFFHRLLAFCLCIVLSTALLPVKTNAITLSGNQAEDIVTYAESMVGKKDERGKQCAGFVCTAAMKVGMTSSQINTNATAASPWVGSNQFGFLDSSGNTKYGCSAYTWKDFKEGNYTPRTGDLVFFGYIKGSTAGSASLTIKQLASKDYWHVHVGIIRNNNSTTGKIYSVDGGQSGSDSSSTWVKNKDRSTTASSGAVSGWTSSGYTVHVLEFIRPNYQTVAPSSNYLDNCTSSPSHVDLEIKNKTTMKTFPCSAGTDSSSKDVITLSVGAKLVGTQLWKNTAGNYWYKASYTSGGTTYSGYVFAGDCISSQRYDVSVSGVTAPTGTMTVGESLTLKGKVTSSVLPLVKVGAFVYSGTQTSGTAATGGWASTTAKTFEIKGSAADNNCKIGSLAEGAYTYTIKAQVTNNWATDGTTLKTETKTLLLHSNAFSEARVTYQVSYDANGGTGAPAAQTKTHGTALTLSSTKPTRADASAGSYTVTLNANGGSVSPTSLTASRTTKYTFKNWNTNRDGSGTSYNPGGSYTVNAAATLYAQWNSSVTTAAVTLPTPTRGGYTFKGWGTSAGATSGVTGSYTPSGNVTLYAVWEQNTPNTYSITYDANGGTGAPAAQTKTHGTALTLSSTKPTRADASAGSYTVTLNANGGSVSPTSLKASRTTKYTFKNWNTAANGSGTSYNAGASYTANAAATLYAQWNSSVTTAAVTLPTPTRGGYTFKGWGTSTSATSGVTGSYTPSGDETLYAIWEPNAVPPQDLFTDVSNPSEYYYDAVYWARDKGITTGRTPTTFDPYAPCTRGQIVTFLWRMMGEPSPASGSNPFTDVKPGDYFYTAVLWAYSRGITTGKTDTTFQPYSPCTREQSVTFLWRAAGKPGSGGGNPFGDVKAGTYYYDAVRWAVANGITTGRTSTVFGVGQTCTRAQIVTFLYRYAG